MAMKFCPQCGTPRGGKFCGGCGYAFPNEASMSPEASVANAAEQPLVSVLPYGLSYGEGHKSGKHCANCGLPTNGGAQRCLDCEGTN